MGILSYLKPVIQYLFLFLRKATAAQMRAALLFFTSGWKSYLGFFLVVILGNRKLLGTGNATQIITGIGEKLTTRDQIIAQNLEKILSGAQGVNYIDAITAIFFATIFILWYIRTIERITYLGAGDNVPPYFRFGLGFAFYFLVVYAVAGRWPTALLDLLKNIDTVIQPKQFDFLNRNNTSVQDTVKSGNWSSW